jgi:hypothetical protein
VKVSELKHMLNHSDRHDDDDVCIVLSMPSMGPRASSLVKSASFGFDWEKGQVMLTPEKRLSEKTKEEDVYHAASDLLMYIATKPAKRESYETRRSKQILLRCGYTEEDLLKYRRLFHKEDA